MNIQPISPIFHGHGCSCPCACCRQNATQKRIEEINRQMDQLARERDALQRMQPPVVFPLPAPSIPPNPVFRSPFDPFLSVDQVIQKVK